MDRRWLVMALAVGWVVGVLLGPTEALRCRTNEGPSSEEVKRIVQTCLNKITNPGENRSSDEYPNYDSSYSDDSSEEQQHQQQQGSDGDGKAGAGNKRGQSKSSMGSGRYDGNDRGYGSGGGGKSNRPEDGDRRQMGDRRGDQRNTGEGRRRMDSERGQQRQRYDEDDMMRDYGRQQPYRRRKRQYYGNQGGGSMGSGGDFSMANGRAPAYQTYGENGTTSNGPRGTGNSSSLERDRACLMQCFFEELKATNADGFPEKHKVLHVITKDIRDRELRDFYVDSIQECFRMIGMDSRLKDRCDYSMHFVTCLSDRFQSNCNDWDMDVSPVF